jgi:hypothetical protein
VARHHYRVLDLAAPEVAERGASFIVSVDARGADPAHPVTVRLDCKMGVSPLRPLGQGVFWVSRGRVAFASFKVALSETGTVVLVATAHDSSSSVFRPDVTIVRVT